MADDTVLAMRENVAPADVAAAIAVVPPPQKAPLAHLFTQAVHAGLPR
jgi:hypothetical protein